MVGGIEVTNMHQLTDTPFALSGVVAYSPCCFVQLLEKAMERERERYCVYIYRYVYNKPQKDQQSLICMFLFLWDCQAEGAIVALYSTADVQLFINYESIYSNI